MYSVTSSNEVKMRVNQWAPIYVFAREAMSGGGKLRPNCTFMYVCTCIFVYILLKIMHLSTF